MMQYLRVIVDVSLALEFVKSGLGSGYGFIALHSASTTSLLIILHICFIYSNNIIYN